MWSSVGFVYITQDYDCGSEKLSDLAEAAQLTPTDGVSSHAIVFNISLCLFSFTT